MQYLEFRISEIAKWQVTRAFHHVIYVAGHHILHRLKIQSNPQKATETLNISVARTKKRTLDLDVLYFIYLFV
jgi:hypothetical protein